MKTKILLIGLLSILVNFGHSQTVPSYVPNNGLVGWWPFNGNANDESGNGNHGTAIGASLTDDRFGSPSAAFSLNGVNQMLEFPNMTELNVDTFSVSFYTLPNSYNIHNKVNFGTIASAMRFVLNFSSTTISYSPITCAGSYAASGNWSNQGGVGLGDWHHLVYVIKGSTSLFYIDGFLIEQLNNASNLTCFNSNMLLYFGGDIGGGSIEYFNGKFDDIGIWNRALTPNEISMLYNSLCDTTLTSFLADTISSCGSSVELSPSFNFSSYSWSNLDTTHSILATETGWYSCQVTDSNACVYEDSTFVSLVSANILQTDTTICLGQSAQLSVEEGFSANSSSSLSGSLTNGLMGWWPFNGNANDESGNGNNGTVNGAIITIDRFGNANKSFSFNNANNWIEIPNSPNITLLGNLTMTAWVKTTGANGHNYQTIISKRETYWTWEYAMCLSYHSGIIHDTKLATARGVGMGNQQQAWSQTPYQIMEWEFWAVTFNNGQAIIYKNGNVDTSMSMTINPIAQNCPLLFGKNTLTDSSEPFSGSLDDIGIWNRALSPAEVEQLYSPAIPLTYSWSNGDTIASISVSPAETTTYYCTVSNGISSCVDSVTVTVNNPLVNLGNDTTLCDGTLYVCNAGNFTSYSWSTGDTTSSIETQMPGTYSVTVTDSIGCSNSDSINVSYLSALTFTLGPDISFCPGASLIINPGLYSNYIWSTGESSQSINVTQAGVYAVTVSDENLCRASDTIEASLLPTPTIDLGNDIFICDGETAGIVAQSGFASYEWSNGNQTATLTTSISGNFSLTVSDANGCQGSDQISVTTYPYPIILTQPSNQSAYLQDEAIFSVSANNVSNYQWQTDIGFGFQNLSNAGQFSGVSNPVLTVSNLTLANDGQLFRCILSNWQCPDTSSIASLQVRNEQGISDNEVNHIKIYPNPAKDKFLLEIDPFLQGKRYKIINLFGEEVKNGELTEIKTTIHVANLPVGAYILMILNDAIIYEKILIK